MTYNWNTPSNIFSINTTLLDSISLYLNSPPAGTMGAERVSLSAAYYLNVLTSQWSDNNSKYPNLSEQYQNLIDALVTYFTAKNIVVILDLHWNDDVTGQQSMALKATTSQVTGDSTLFFDTLSKKYGSNNLVMYELYNEPYAGLDIWMNGDDTHTGMVELYNTVRKNTQNPVIIGGALDYAYDAQSLVTFDTQVNPKNVIYNFHPYMGPNQQGDSTKLPTNFKKLACQILSIKRPLIMKELGQYCCGETSCYIYDGTYNGGSMGYVNAILETAKEMSLSWTIWAWRPNTTADCSQPDVNSGSSLATASSNCVGNSGCGADFATLWKKYF